MENTRLILATDANGNPTCKIVGLSNAFDGTMTKEELRELIKLSGLTKHNFWKTFLREKCGWSTFKTWYLDSYNAPVPDFLLIFLTARYQELFHHCKSIY